MYSSGRMPVAVSSEVYLVVRQLLKLVVLPARTETSKDVEVLVVTPAMPAAYDPWRDAHGTQIPQQGRIEHVEDGC